MLLATWLWIWLVLDGQIATVASSLPSTTTTTSSSFGEWFRARCGPLGSSTWLYQGGLYDPLTGDQLAHVEGMEIVHAVATTDPTRIKEHNEASSLRNNIDRKSTKPPATAVISTEEDNPMNLLSIQKSLQHPEAKFTQSGTILSQKIFIYRQKDNPQNLLQKVKLRPYSPERDVPIGQAVSVYATVNTFIEKSPNEWIVHGEWPDGRTVWNRATVVRPRGQAWPHTTTSTNDVGRDANKIATKKKKRRSYSSSGGDDIMEPETNSLEFIVHIRPRSMMQSKQGPDLTTEPLQSLASANNATSSSAATKSPPRSALFSFGPSKSERPGMGARETYQYEWKKHSSGRTKTSKRGWFVGGKKSLSFQTAIGNDDGEDCTVRYTRYGEGPVWYGPNRFCTLELRGRRWPPNAPLPTHIEEWCQRHGWTTACANDVPNNHGNNIYALVRAFRQPDDFLRIKDILGSRENAAANMASISAAANNLKGWRNTVWWAKRARHWGNKLRQAVTLELSPS